MQHIRLVLMVIHCPAKGDELRSVSAQAHIMTGSHKIGAYSESVLEQEIPPDFEVADQAGIRCQSMRIAINEGFHDRFIKYFLGVYGKEGHAEKSSYPACLGHCVGCTAAIFVLCSW